MSRTSKGVTWKKGPWVCLKRNVNIQKDLQKSNLKATCRTPVLNRKKWYDISSSLWCDISSGWNNPTMVWLKHFRKSTSQIVFSYLLSFQLDCFRATTNAKRPRKTIVFQPDMARPHFKRPSVGSIAEKGWNLLPYPPYSPTEAPKDYHANSSFKNWHRNKIYDNLDGQF